MTYDDLTTGSPAPPSSPTSDHPAAGAIEALADAAELAIAVLGVDGSLLHANASGARLFGLSAGAEQITTDALRIVLDQIPKQLLTGPEDGTWAGEMSFGSVLGRPTSHRVTVHVRHDPQHPAGGSIAVMADDVSEERERVARLVHQLEHDRTTGLLNRSSAIDRVTAALGRPSLGTTAVYMIDIDRLADVNDALGHDIGDRLLASTARRLATAVRPDDLVARMGGDEFLVLCTSLADPPAAMELADRIRRSLTGRLTIHQLELDVSVSVGVAIAGNTPAQALDESVDLAVDDPIAGPGVNTGERSTEPAHDDPDADDEASDPRRRALELISQADTAVHAAKHGRPGAHRTVHRAVGEPGTGADRALVRPLQGVARRPTHARVPVDLLRRVRAGRGRRGAAALEPPDPRSGGSRRVHPDRRGDGRDRPDRGLGAAAGVRDGAAVDRRRPGGRALLRARQRVPSPVGQPVVREPGRRSAARVPTPSASDRARGTRGEPRRSTTPTRSSGPSGRCAGSVCGWRSTTSAPVRTRSRS